MLIFQKFVFEIFFKTKTRKNCQEREKTENNVLTWSQNKHSKKLVVAPEGRPVALAAGDGLTAVRITFLVELIQARPENIELLRKGVLSASPYQAVADAQDLHGHVETYVGSNSTI